MMHPYYGLGAPVGTPTSSDLQTAWDDLAERFGANMAAIEGWRHAVLAELPALSPEAMRVWRNIDQGYAQGRQMVLAAWTQAGIARGRSLEEAVPKAVKAVRMTDELLATLARIEAMWPSSLRQVLMRVHPYLTDARDATAEYLRQMGCIMPSLRTLPGVPPCGEEEDPYNDALRILAIGGAVVGGLALLYVAYPYLRDLRNR